ncbi:GNAT family N-acetyltransferase [Roseiarcaceae bacterium H3SJ34-1]|uniref:GNAT family N-acetyltransferase n=1 Tax=Terripilifer ovatus TaxID=3032367 RepID=UPI003AB9382C|nr:GNAT family N-acetyltransferase [Roseiarcaceae bacterium H3SJ34-1]
MIRDATAADAQEICRLLRRSIAELCLPDHHGHTATLEGWLSNKTPANVGAWIASPDMHVWVFMRGGAMAGVGMLSGAGEIMLNYVAPEARFSGISTALLAHMETYAAAHRLSSLRLTSTWTARDFYLARGYEPEKDEGDIFDADDGCELVKQIAPAPKL